jgi:hypothetical protein
MDSKHRDLILAAEISGMLHDLGKLRAEFAEEFLEPPVPLSKEEKDKLKEDKKGFVESTKISNLHGAVLENPRAYPQQDSDSWLNDVKAHAGWASVMRIPEGWANEKVVQAHGLGDALRQHHANNNFPVEEQTLLGDIYALGADVRDSALDKGSGGAKSGKQTLGKGFIANSFGKEDQQKQYDVAELEKSWAKVSDVLPAVLFADEAWTTVPKTRKKLIEKIETIFRNALGETRRPTNDVTLWHHSSSTASLFKAAVAEGVLRQNFQHLQKEDGLFDIGRSGQIRFRLLGIRWDWLALTQGALKPVLFSALSNMKEQAIEELQQLFEETRPVGNLIYQDDNGAIFAVPAFYEVGDESQSTALFKTHIVDSYRQDILNVVAETLGVGTTVRIAWTEPALYLTDYPDVVPFALQGKNEELLQAGLSELKAHWQKMAQNGLVQICAQCGIRPAPVRELEIYDSGLDDDETKLPQGWCDHCVKLSEENTDRWKKSQQRHFGFSPETFNLQKIRKQRNSEGNARVVMISVNIDAEKIVSGESFASQLARPISDITDNNLNSVEAGDLLQHVWEELHKNPTDEDLRAYLTNGKKKKAVAVGRLVGDGYWTYRKDEDCEQYEYQDGRSAAPTIAKKMIEVAKNFFFKEFVPEGLCRHGGDKLLLFGMRKHASPARLSRTWDDLNEIWLEILSMIGVETENYAMPISLDAHGFRVIVAAKDARRILLKIQETLQERFSKVRGGIAPQISALIFRDKFPLYVAMDAMRRMEQRKLLKQEWTVLKRQHNGNNVMLHWATPQGEVTWNIDIGTGDSKVPDIWYPHVICHSRPEGLERLVHVKELNEGDKVTIPISTFDFAVLDGTARRYEISYDAEGSRNHFILGAKGYKPYLLEHMPKILQDFPEKIAKWNPSQSKAILGQLVECYEKWVRDVPENLKADGRKAWHLHADGVFARANVNIDDRRVFLDSLDNGQFFDAFEWATFIEKKQANNDSQQDQ